VARIRLWQLGKERLAELQESSFDFEKRLEDLIEANPSLLEHDLVILGRQVPVQGGRIDLLGIDSQNRLTVIELKPDPLRREAIGQALDYASWVSTAPVEELRAKVDAYLKPRNSSLDAKVKERGLGDIADPDQRDVAMVLVGVGDSPGLERLTDYLAGYELPITMVSFQVFKSENGSQVLSRELREEEAARPRKRPPIDELRAAAQGTGAGAAFDALFEAGRRHELHMRTDKACFWYAPARQKSRAMFTVWLWPAQPGRLRLGVWHQAFSEFYPPVTEEEAASLLGPRGPRVIADKEAQLFVDGLDRLFRLVAERGPSSTPDSG